MSCLKGKKKLSSRGSIDVSSRDWILTDSPPFFFKNDKWCYIHFIIWLYSFTESKATSSFYLSVKTEALATKNSLTLKRVQNFLFNYPTMTRLTQIDYSLPLPSSLESGFIYLLLFFLTVLGHPPRVITKLKVAYLEWPDGYIFFRWNIYILSYQ